MIKHRIILAGLIAQFLWYFLLSFINESLQYYNWTTNTKIVFFILLIVNIIYVLLQSKDENENE